MKCKKDCCLALWMRAVRNIECATTSMPKRSRQATSTTTLSDGETPPPPVLPPHAPCPSPNPQRPNGRRSVRVTARARSAGGNNLKAELNFFLGVFPSAIGRADNASMAMYQRKSTRGRSWHCIALSPYVSHSRFPAAPASPLFLPCFFPSRLARSSARSALLLCLSQDDASIPQLGSQCASGASVSPPDCVRFSVRR